MASDAETAPRDAGDRQGPPRPALWAFAAGLVLAAGAGLALWAQVGSDVFLTQAFSALAACF